MKVAGNTGYPTEETLRRRERDAVLKKRYRILLDTFSALNEPGDPWMCRLSENDADTIILIGGHIRTPADVYHFQNAKNWTVITAAKVAGMVNGHLFSAAMEDVAVISVPNSSEGIEINGRMLVASPQIAPKLEAALQAVVKQVATEDNASWAARGPASARPAGSVGRGVRSG
jgi:hypothetical protein